MKRIQLKTLLKLCVMIICLYSCNHSEHSNKVEVAEVDVNESFAAVSEKEVSVEKPKEKFTDLKIIKSAHVRYKVGNVKLATNTMKRMAQKYNAYVSEMRFENNLYNKENRFTLKVPAVHFDVIMDSLSVVSEFIEFENITTRDVTSEYIDLEARLKTKIETKKRYESILRTKAKNVKDLLETEEKLQGIQEEIEVAQGRLKYLTNKVAFSTIQIDLYEAVDYKEEPKQYNRTFFSEIKEGFVSGWEIIKTFFIGIVYIWPLILIVVFLFVILRKRLKK